MADFDSEYSKLNSAQKQAVDSIDGPLLVIAGPGTGKTQLLSMRVANILRLSDVSPRNILCLTFTDSAATAMRERLLGLIGIDAHKVAIHTFHSFGVEVINQYPEYFYSSARFSPSDDVTQVEIINSILAKLDHDSPLASTMNNRFIYLKPIKSAIDYLKKSGLNSEDLRSILAANESDIAEIEPKIAAVFNQGRISKSMLPKLADVASKITISKQPDLPKPFEPLSKVLLHSLSLALDEAEDLGKTTPITNWRNAWMEKSSRGEYVFKDHHNNAKLYVLADVYEEYQQTLKREEKYDFSDMVLDVVQAIESHDELRFALQEQYQYFLVDEFQDTNEAQLRLLNNLVDNPIHEGRPDVMVVGDDDQAIYKFQGAEVSNIVSFYNKYRDVQLITLTQNYRSTQEILDLAKSVITGAETRLENTIDEVHKDLTSDNKKQDKGQIQYKRLPTSEHQYLFVAEEISRLIKQGKSASDIAVLARQHTQLEQLMPYLSEANIPVVYERRSNVLDQRHIAQLLDLAYLVHFLTSDNQELANEYLSKVLSYPFWGIDPVTTWRLSRQAYEEGQLWLEAMLASKDKSLSKLANWLLECAHQAKSQPLEHVIDILIGVKKLSGFKSPYRDYYFSSEKFDENRGEYLAFLSALRLLRNKLREYHYREVIYLKDLVGFIDTHRDNEIPIVDETPFVSHDTAVEVMSAHKAKGLEFDTVFVLDCQEKVWTPSASRQSIRFPANLPITPAGDHLDDQLRLFFVAATRAKSNLYLLGSKHSSSGKESLLAPFLDHQLFEDIKMDDAKTIEVLETSWQSYQPLPREADAKAVLKPILKDYKLNATAYIKFLDVIRGGPKAFLLESLLRFPQAPSVSAAFGTAMHNTLNELYYLLSQGKKPQRAEVLDIFAQALRSRRLKKEDEAKLLKRGQDSLKAYLAQRQEYMDPKDLIEINFTKQGVVAAGVPITGKIDKLVLDKDKKKAEIYDFKTGQPIKSLSAQSGPDGLKAWQYRNQLAFYRLLLENSRSWSEYRVSKVALEFLEPDKKSGEIVLLESEVSDEEVDRTVKLMQAIYTCIQNLDFPDVSKYDKDLKGIKAFEEDLLKRVK